jgi:hypothetical protein
MKAKLEAGMTLDFLTSEELRGELASAMKAWRSEIARGVRFPKFSGQGVITGGAFRIGGDGDANKSRLGPDAGFVWAVVRLSAFGGGFVPGTDSFNVWIDEVTPSRLVETGITRTAKYDITGLVLVGPESLVFTGTSTGTDPVTVAGQAVELPVQLAYSLVS